MSDLQYSVRSRYSGEQGHLPGSDITTHLVTEVLDDAFREADKIEQRGYVNVWVEVERKPRAARVQ